MKKSDYLIIFGVESNIKWYLDKFLINFWYFILSWIKLLIIFINWKKDIIIYLIWKI